MSEDWFQYVSFGRGAAHSCPAARGSPFRVPLAAEADKVELPLAKASGEVELELGFPLEGSSPFDPKELGAMPELVCLCEDSAELMLEASSIVALDSELLAILRPPQTTANAAIRSTGTPSTSHKIDVR